MAPSLQFQPKFPSLKGCEVYFSVTFHGRRRCRIVRSLIVYDGDNNENVKTARGLLSKQQVCRCITLFCTFLCRCCKNTTGNCLILRFMEDVNKRRRNFLSLPKLECGSQENERQGNSPTFTFSVNWNKRDKVWKTLIHFKSDVFAAVAVVDAKTPLYGFGRRLYGWNFCSWLFFVNWRVFLRLLRFSTLLKNQLDQGSWRKTKNNEVDMQPI